MRKTKKKKFHSLFIGKNKGNITINILLGIIIVGSILLVSGIFPHYQMTPADPNATPVVPIDDGHTVQKNSLELKTLKFQTCSTNTAIGFLVDVSGSMAYGNKIGNVKKALTAFSQKTTDNSIVGLYSFSNTPVENVPFSYYKDVKTKFNAAINALRPEQATYTRRAFEFVKPKLEAAKNNFPQYQFSLVFISDGIPESVEYTLSCQNSRLSFGAGTPNDCKLNCKLGTTPGEQTRCFSPDQNPTASPNLAQELKDEGIRIYSIAILDQQDDRFNTQLTQLLQDVASPDSFYVSPTGQDLSDIMNKIGSQMCKEVN